MHNAGVHKARQNHFNDFHRSSVGHPFAVYEFGLDVQPAEHVVDHRAAAVNDDGVHADLAHKCYVARELFHRIVAAHGVTAQLDNNGRVSVTLQVGERLAQGACGGDPVAIHVLFSHSLPR